MGLLLLVRHGQASYGADDYDVLSELGWAQARTLGAALAAQGVRPDVLISGTLRRQRDTLTAIAEAAGWPLDQAVRDAGWDEFDHESLLRTVDPLPPGHTRAEFQQRFSQAALAWALAEEPEAPEDPESYPESYSAFTARVDDALATAAREAGSGQTVLVVSSGGPISSITAGLVDPEAGPQARARGWARLNTVTVNTGVTRVIVGGSGLRLLTFNEHSHLDAHRLSYR